MNHDINIFYNSYLLLEKVFNVNFKKTVFKIIIPWGGFVNLQEDNTILNLN